MENTPTIPFVDHRGKDNDFVNLLWVSRVKRISTTQIGFTFNTGKEVT